MTFHSMCKVVTEHQALLPQVRLWGAAIDHVDVRSPKCPGLYDWLLVEFVRRLQEVVGLSNCKGWGLCHGPKLCFVGSANIEKPSNHHSASWLLPRVGSNR